MKTESNSRSGGPAPKDGSGSRKPTPNSDMQPEDAGTADSGTPDSGQADSGTLAKTAMKQTSKTGAETGSKR